MFTLGNKPWTMGMSIIVQTKRVIRTQIPEVTDLFDVLLKKLESCENQFIFFLV